MYQPTIGTTMDILEDTYENGGGTYYWDGDKVTSGFAVAIVPGSFAKVDAVDLKVGFHFDKAVRDIFDKYTFEPHVYLGTWLHDGVIHVDPVVVVRTAAEAHALAVKYQQQAYYDLTDGREYWVNKQTKAA